MFLLLYFFFNISLYNGITYLKLKVTFSDIQSVFIPVSSGMGGVSRNRSIHADVIPVLV